MKLLLITCVEETATLNPRGRSVGRSVRSAPHLKGIAFKTLVSVVVVVTDVGGLPDRSLERNKFCV